MTTAQWESDRAAWWASHWAEIESTWSATTPQGAQRSGSQVHESLNVHDTFMINTTGPPSAIHPLSRNMDIDASTKRNAQDKDLESIRKIEAQKAKMLEELAALEAE